MALNNNFYNDIFSKEEIWKNQIKHGLLNSIYCDYDLKPFYLEKRSELESENDVSNNIMLGEILRIINQILVKIEEFHIQYKLGKSPNMDELLPIFLTSQMKIS